MRYNGAPPRWEDRDNAASGGTDCIIFRDFDADRTCIFITTPVGRVFAMNFTEGDAVAVIKRRIDDEQGFLPDQHA